MLDDFLVRAVLAGIGIAIAAAPLGCFLVWRRMAYFGDATAHAAILGVALSLAFGMSIFAGTLAIALLMAFTLSSIEGRGLGMDTILGVLAHSSLAIGLVVASFISGLRVDLNSYLFGDILSVGHMDLSIIWAGALFVLVLMYWRWNALLLVTLNTDLAQAAGINPKKEKQILMLCLALIIAVAIKVIGALLVGAMLIIPAAGARLISSSPERMAIMAAVIGALSVILGLLGAYEFDSPAGPSIVTVTAIFFMAISVINNATNR